MGNTPARDVDLADWLDGIGFHPANTELKQVGHELARSLVALVGTHLNMLLPPGREKSLVFTHLEEVLMWGNKALAVHDGPKPSVALEDAQALLTELRQAQQMIGATLPRDARIEQYEAEQRGEVAKSPDGDGLFIDVRNNQVTLTHTMDDRFLSVAVNGEVRARVEPRERQVFNLVDPKQVRWSDGTIRTYAETEINKAQDEIEGVRAEQFPRWDNLAQNYDATVTTDDAEIKLEVSGSTASRRVQVGVTSTPERVKMCQDDASRGEGPKFTGFYAGFTQPDHLAAFLREVSAAGEVAFRDGGR
jgi:hypothetical protein